jgi:hypothetical protein
LRVGLTIATEDSERAKRTHFGLADTAQTRVLIGFSGNVTLYGLARNYQNMKILAAQN